jgi:hypothetical protein
MLARIAPKNLFKLAVVPLLLLVASCAEPFDAKVTRFAAQLPPPGAGQSFAVVADEPGLGQSLEFQQYAGAVTTHLAQLGYTPAPSADAAALVVHFAYDVDKGREHLRQRFDPDPFWGPWYHYRNPWARGYWGPRTGAWGYGWYDPWFDNGLESYTVYTSTISLKIDRKADNQRLFEGRAEAASTSNHLTYLVPNLIEAMFSGFPGNSGKTVRISVAPEKVQGRK